MPPARMRLRTHPPTAPSPALPLPHSTRLQTSILPMCIQAIEPRPPVKPLPSARAKPLQRVDRLAHLQGLGLHPMGRLQLATVLVPHTVLSKMRKEDYQMVGNAVKITWDEHITSTTTPGKLHGSDRARVSTRQTSAEM